MGWTYIQKPEGISLEEFLKEELNALDVALVDDGEELVAYAAVNCDEEVSATVCFLDLGDAKSRSPLKVMPEGCNIGYKDIHECEGPAATDCPKRILDQLTPGTNELSTLWRAEAYKNYGITCFDGGRYDESIESFKLSTL